MRRCNGRAKVGAGATAPAGQLAPLTARIRAEFPAVAHDTLFTAIVRLAEYQDVAYAVRYLDRLRPFVAPAAPMAADGRLLSEAARHLAVWMAYDDGIKVAQEKIRAVRFDGVAKDVRQGADQLIAIREFLHPRVEEVADILPAGIGRWLLKSSFAAGFFGKPKVVTTTSLRGFLSLWLVAALRPLRRGSLRFQREDAQIGDWLDRLAALAAEDYELAVAFARVPRLIKGYGDTHLRGHRNLTAVVAALPAVRRQALPAAALGALIAAALADEEGKSLKTALQGMGA